MLSFKEWIQFNESKTTKTITVSCRDYDNTLEKLLNHIKDSGNVGHSFSIVVDPGNDEKSFGWDGDGGDYIEKVEVSDIKQETMTSTSCVAGFARPMLPEPVRRNSKKKKKDEELDEAKDIQGYNKMAGLISAFRKAGGSEKDIEFLQEMYQQRLKGNPKLRGHGSPSEAFYGVLSWIRKSKPQVHRAILKHFDPWYRNVLEMPQISMPL